MNRKFGIVLIIMFIALSCKKENRLDCVKSTGKIITEERVLENVSYFNIQDKVNVFFRFDSITKIEVECGENLVDLIKTDKVGDTLFIGNSNKCNWVRSFKTPVNVYITTKSIDKITYTGVGNVTFLDTLNIDSFRLNVPYGSGSFNLLLNTHWNHLAVGPAAVDITVAGRCDVAYLYNGGTGPFNCLGYKCKFVSMMNYGPNDCYVAPIETLSADINYVGNIYYSGNPSKIDHFGRGTGKLIKL